MDDARGMHSDHVMYSDLDVEKLDALPDTAFHRNVDRPLIEAEEEGYVSTYLITPGSSARHTLYIETIWIATPHRNNLRPAQRQNC